MEAHEFIDGHEKVVAHMGLWPSFHDAEVIKLILDRSNDRSPTERLPTLDLLLRGWVMTPDSGNSGPLCRHGEAVFHFRFSGLSQLEVDGFNSQNVITAMNLAITEHPRETGRKVLRVELEHCYMFEASFVAETARLVNITPVS